MTNKQVDNVTRNWDKQNNKKPTDILTMRITFLFLLVLFTKGLFSQSIEKVEESLEKKDFPLFKHAIQKLIQVKSGFPEETTYREILNGYTEVVSPIRIFVASPADTIPDDCLNYRINLVAKDSLIIKYSLYKISYDQGERLNIIKDYSNDAEIELFRYRYEQRFYRSLNLDELFDNSSTYGDHCGIAGMSPTDRILMNKYIDSDNRKKLFYMLTSPCFEKKLYGYEGLKALRYIGYDLTEKEKKIISNLKDFKGPVKTCSGCSMETGEFYSFVNSINDSRSYIAMTMAKKKLEKRSGYLKFILIGLFILFGIGLIFRNRKAGIMRVSDL
jgi:hypothetical protein